MSPLLPTAPIFHPQTSPQEKESYLGFPEIPSQDRKTVFKVHPGLGRDTLQCIREEKLVLKGI